MKFNQYFLKETQVSLKTTEDLHIDLPTALGSSYDEPYADVGCALLSKEDRSLFLENLGLLNAKNILKLSRRELECLQHVHQGLTSLESGQRLGLSSRTVEGYLESIKNKLGCYSKKELKETAELLHIAKYF
jgi:LuxR family transcriptional regulator